MGAFYALRFPAFRLLWINALVFIFAVTAQGIGRSWLAFEITGTNKGLAGVQLAMGVFMLVGTPIGGVVADRVDKRLIVTTTMILMALSSLWVGVAVLMDATTYWLLIVTSAIQGLSFAFYSPARIALISHLVDRRTMPNAVVVTQLGYAGMLTLGPAIAGVLIGVESVGVAGIFLGSGVMCAITAVSCARLPKSKAQRAERPQRISLLSDFREGVSFVRHDRHLSLLASTCLLTVFVAYPYQIFLPEVAKRFDGGAELFGWMSALVATGSVITGFAVAKVAARANLVLVYGASGVALGIALLLLGLSGSLALSLVLLVLLGGMILLFQTTNQAVIMNHSPDEMHGRLQSVVLLGFSGTGLVALPLGAAADEFGIAMTFALMGGFTIAINLVFIVMSWRSGLLRHVDEDAAIPTPAGIK